MTKSCAIGNLDNVASRHNWRPPFKMGQIPIVKAAIKDCRDAGVEDWKTSAVLRGSNVPKSQFGL